jgi:hypothetical protein
MVMVTNYQSFLDDDCALIKSTMQLSLTEAKGDSAHDEHLRRTPDRSSLRGAIQATSGVPTQSGASMHDETNGHLTNFS